MTRAACLVLFVLSACTGGGLTSGASQGVSVAGDGGDQNDAAPTPITGGIACGTQTCGADQYCFTDCCESQFNPCYARPSGGCKHASDEIPSCNGVAHGCVCDESDPSKCPAPPSCDHASEPFCITMSGPVGSCDFPSAGGSPCFASAGECNPNTRVIVCTCGS